MSGDKIYMNSVDVVVSRSEKTLSYLSYENSVLKNEYNVSNAQEWCAVDPEFPHDSTSLSISIYWPGIYTF